MLPTWLLVPFLVAVILALVSGAVLGIYSSGLTLLSLGVRIPRPAAALVDGVILTLGTIWVVFFAESFIGPFQSFLITLGVPLAAWAGIMIADIALRKRDYDDEALFDARGRYGALDWVSIGTMVVASVLGWGLVVNSFAADAAWNNWQGYLLEPLGLGTYVDDPAGPYWDGNWPYANLGVLLALVLASSSPTSPGAAGCAARRPPHRRRPRAAGRPRARTVTERRRRRRRLVGRRRPAGRLRRPGDLAVGLPHVGGGGAAHRRAGGILRAGPHRGDPVRGRPLAGRLVGAVLPRLAVRARARLRPAVRRRARAGRRRRPRGHGRHVRQVAGAARPGRRRRPPHAHRGVDRLLRALDGPAGGGCRGDGARGGAPRAPGRARRTTSGPSPRWPSTPPRSPSPDPPIAITDLAPHALRWRGAVDGSEEAGEGQDGCARRGAERTRGEAGRAGAEGLAAGERRAGGQAGAPADEQHRARRRPATASRSTDTGSRVEAAQPDAKSQVAATRSAR